MYYIRKLASDFKSCSTDSYGRGHVKYHVCNQEWEEIVPSEEDDPVDVDFGGLPEVSADVGGGMDFAVARFDAQRE